MKKILLPICCVALTAPAIELSAWRGETVSAWVPQGEKIAFGASGKNGASFSRKDAAPKDAAPKDAAPKDAVSDKKEPEK